MPLDEGGLDTERARAYLASLPHESRPTAKRGSPQFTGIAALYDSNRRMKLSGRALIGADLGGFPGVTDVDGSHPFSDRYTMGGRLSFICLSWRDRNLNGLSGHIGHRKAGGFIHASSGWACVPDCTKTPLDLLSTGAQTRSIE
jgi:hypothetical protein